MTMGRRAARGQRKDVREEPAAARGSGVFFWHRGGGPRAALPVLAAACVLTLTGGAPLSSELSMPPPPGDEPGAAVRYARDPASQASQGSQASHGSHAWQASHAAQASQVAATRAASCDKDHPEVSLNPSSASGPAVERIRQRKKLIVGVDQNSYRWGYRDPATREIVGFDIDLVKAIARNLLGSEDAVIYRTVPTSKRFEAIHDRDVDMVVRTVTISCARINDSQFPVLFSAGYFRAGQQLLVPRRYSTITGYDTSLRGKTVCTAKKSTGLDRLNQDREKYGMRIMTVDNQLDCLVRLQLGQVQAVFTDNALAAGQAAQDPTVRLVGRPVTKEYYGVAVNPGDTDLVRRVNQVLQEYTSGGDNSPWMQAYRTWLKADLRGITGPPKPSYAG
jgi:polar amino acid transport system substrate-binding protein